MGLGISMNLLAAGIEVRAWNRSPEKVKMLEGEGAAVVATPAEAARDADVVLTVLSDTGAVLEVMEGDEGVLAGASPGTTWVQSSTIGIEGIERCRELAEREGLALFDAPVLGTKKPAEEGDSSFSPPVPRRAATRSGRSSRRSANARSGSVTWPGPPAG
jgi:3-hydroxyisobutyrate dehydrogenase